MQRSRKIPVRGLHQPTERIAAITLVEREIVQRGQRTRRRDFEDRATAVFTSVVLPAVRRCSIEVAIGSLHHRGGRLCTVSLVKAVKRGQGTRWRDSENRTAAFVPARAVGATGCSSIEVSVGADNQPRVREGAVSADCL